MARVGLIFLNKRSKTAVKAINGIRPDENGNINVDIMSLSDYMNKIVQGDEDVTDKVANLIYEALPWCEEVPL